MNDMYITKSVIQFKNPTIGQPTRPIAEHYNGRRITVMLEDKERIFHFSKSELAFDVTEEEMLEAVLLKLEEEQSK